jgi:hypothetical protein
MQVIHGLTSHGDLNPLNLLDNRQVSIMDIEQTIIFESLIKISFSLLLNSQNQSDLSDFNFFIFFRN